MKTNAFFLLCLFLCIAVQGTFAQEWTKSQKEVWQIVDDSWTKFKAGDIEGSLAYIHDKYQGWNDEIPLPITKEMVRQFSQEYKDIEKINHFTLFPGRIVITENAAVVDYFYWYEATYTTGEKKKTNESKGRNVEFYIKEGGKWLLLGDMTTHEKTETDKDD
jgi:hypothetical protein